MMIPRDESTKSSNMERITNSAGRLFAMFGSGRAKSAKANREHASDAASFVEGTEEETSPHPRPRLPDTVRDYSSKLDNTKGPLRTTSDGNLIEETTGDWLVLNTPPHDREDREIALQHGKNTAKRPAVGLPESKNGATGLDDPRARKSIARLIRNKLSGSDCPPVESVDSVVSEKKAVQARAAQQYLSKLEKVEMRLLEDVRQWFGFDIAKELGGDWFEHALVDTVFWLQVLEKVSNLEVS